MRFLILLVTLAYFALAAASFDYVIVGGGATGLALAVRLSEDSSKSVVVLEAGGTNPRGFGNVNITNLRLSRNNFGFREDWQFVTVPQTHAGNSVQAQAQGRVLGAINSGMYTRGNEIEYVALETLVGARGWNWKSMFAAVKKSERFFPPSTPDVQALNVTFNPAFHGIAGPVALSLQALNISRLFPEVVVPTLRALGFEMNFDSNGGRHNGPSWNYLTVLPATSTRSYAVSGYYLPVANRTNIHIMTNSHVSRIIWLKKKTKGGLLRATGVEYLALDNPGGPKVATLNGANIILSASTLNTPKILEVSSVGDPNVLRSIGIDVHIDLPGVGANLCNQPMSTTSFLMRNGTVDVGNAIRSAILDFQPLTTFLNASDLRRSRVMLSAKPAGLSKPQFDIMNQIIETTDIPQVEFAWNVAVGRNGTTNLIFDRIVLLKPFSRGFVHIVSKEPSAPPVIDPKYLSAPHDKFVLAKAVEYTRTLVNTEPLKSHIDGSILPESTVQTEEDFVDFVNTQSQSEHRFVGTAAMTHRSQGGVVDPSLVVVNLHFLTYPAQNLTVSAPGIHTVSLAYMVAERAAEIIKADW